MTTIKRRRRLLLASALGVALGAGILTAYLAGPAAASGVPLKDPLWYGGYLTDATGKPLSGSYTIDVALYTAQTGGTSTCTVGQTTPCRACESKGLTSTVTQGRFRVALGAACLTAVQDFADLWVEVAVGTGAVKTTLPRQKLGAVPFAATPPDTLKVSGDASFTIHSNTDNPTTNTKMLTLKTGATSAKEVLAIDNRGYLGIGSNAFSTPIDVDLNANKIGAGAVEMIRLYAGSNPGDGPYLNFQTGAGQGIIGSERVGYGGTHYGSDMYFKTQDTAIAGNKPTEKMRITSAGHIGIGTTSPGAKLDIKSGDIKLDNYYKIFWSNDYDALDNDNGIFYLRTSGSTYLNIDSNGNGTEALYVQTGATATGGTVLMKIQNNGNVGIGTSSPTSTLHVVGNIYATGTITPGSSRALKQNIHDLALADARATLAGLRPTRFYYKADTSDEHLGFIAEDVPALVATQDRKGVDPMDIAAVLTKVVQQQQVQMAAQQREIEDLKKEMQRMKKKLAEGQ